MKYSIVTGVSRGLGEALALRLLQSGHYVFGISRNRNEKLLDNGKKFPGKLEYFEQDLTGFDELPALMQNIFSRIEEKPQRIGLINNAGIVQPVGPLESASGKEIASNINVNLIAPMMLTGLFIRNSKRFDKIEKRIISISSGAAIHPYAGWSCYCAAKAGINMFTRCTALDMDEKSNNVKIITLAPGVINTSMQGVIRETSKADFPQKEKFIRLYEEGMLTSPEKAAKSIVKLYESEDFPQGEFLDVRD